MAISFDERGQIHRGGGPTPPIPQNNPSPGRNSNSSTCLTVTLVILLIAFLIGGGIWVISQFSNRSTSGIPTATDIAYSTDTSVPTIGEDNQPNLEPATSIPTQPPEEMTPTRKACGGAPPIRVEIGNTVQVTSNGGKIIYLRSEPIVGTNVSLYLHGGDELKIIDGPVCANDVSFFEVEVLSAVEPLGAGMSGWVAEAEADTNNYYIEPVP